MIHIFFIRVAKTALLSLSTKKLRTFVFPVKMYYIPFLYCFILHGYHFEYNPKSREGNNNKRRRKSCGIEKPNTRTNNLKLRNHLGERSKWPNQRDKYDTCTENVVSIMLNRMKPCLDQPA